MPIQLHLHLLVERRHLAFVVAEVLLRLPGVAVGPVALPNAQVLVLPVDAAARAHLLQLVVLFQQRPLLTLRSVKGSARERRKRS